MNIKNEDRKIVLKEIIDFLNDFIIKYNSDLKYNSIFYEYYNKNGDFIMNIYIKPRICLLSIYIHRRLMLILNDIRIFDTKYNVNIEKLKEFFEKYFINVYMIHLINILDYKFVDKKYDFTTFDISELLISRKNNNRLETYFKYLPISIQNEYDYIFHAKNFDII